MNRPLKMGVFLSGLWSGSVAMAGTAGQAYTVTDLGTLGGAISQASGIDANGDVVGTADIKSLYETGHAFLYSNGVMHDLGTFGGGISSGYAINSAGTVVGRSSLSTGEIDPFELPAGGTQQNLGSLGGGTGVANAINSRGQIVGASYVANGTYRGFLYNPGATSLINLGTFGANYGSGTGINDAGLIVGTSQNTSGYYQAFVYDTTGLHNLGTLPGGPDSGAAAINNNGEIVGQSEYGGVQSRYHAFIDAGQGLQDIGTLGGVDSFAHALNDSGVVVGDAYAVGNADHAFVYSNGTMQDLNNLDGNAGWVLQSATAINNGGQIAGYGTNPAGQTHAFLLTPVAVPEPAWIGSVVAGVGGLMRRRRR